MALAHAPEKHTAAECAQWKAMFRPSPLLVRTNFSKFPDVALFSFSRKAFAILTDNMQRVHDKRVTPEVAERVMDLVRAQKGAIEFILATNMRTDGHEVLVYTADLSDSPRPTSQGNIVTLVDKTGELDWLRAICRAIRPASTAFVRILPHVRVGAFPQAEIVESTPLAFFHVHLVPTATYVQGPSDIPL